MIIIKFLLAVSCFLTFISSENRYCVVDYNHPGIHVVDDKKCDKDNQLEPSSLYREKYEIWEINIIHPDWDILNSTKDFSLANMLVLDYRWEFFLNNHNYLREIDNFRSGAKNVDFFWSVKLCQTEDNSITKSKDKWLHLKQSKDNASLFYECDPNRVNGCTNQFTAPDKMNTLFWKIHEYVYSFTKQNNSKVEITNHKDLTKCTTIKEGCFILYLAMCENCKIQLDWNNSKNSKTIKGTGRWNTEGMTVYDISNCSSVTLITYTTTSDPFWAIGDKSYLSWNGSCETLKRYINANESNTYCENSFNEKINYQNKIINETETTQKMQIETSSLNYLYLSFIIAIALIVPIAAFGWSKYKKKTSTQDMENIRLMDASAVNENKNADGIKTIIPKNWPSIKSTNFSKYVRKMFDSNQQDNTLEQQFQDLPFGYLKPATEGRKVENLAKNRFQDIIPYDENRIKLENESSRSKSPDYINASYIHSSKKLREYIITQNPSENTVEDFLQMIWQENVQNIVMISTSNEKFHSYWPNEKKITTHKSLELDVDLVKIKSYEFYDHRVLRFEKGGEIREINHLHFYFWSPDELSTHIFVEFMNHLLSISHNNPVVFHCQDGVDKSGTFILCDIALRSESVPKSYNLFEITKHLRYNRANVVSDLKYYKLAHLIVYETTNFTDSSVEVDYQFVEIFRHVFEGNSLKSLWTNYLEDTKWLQKALISYDVHPEDSLKNRYGNNINRLPVERCRVRLKNRESDYIHAMYVDGFRKENSFIVAQQPLPNTIDDFWLMVLQKHVKFIINVHEIDNPNDQYFPIMQSRIMDRDSIKIYLQNYESNLYYNKYILRVNARGKNPEHVSVYNLKNWAKIKNIPESSDSLISIWNDIFLEKVQNFPIVICCDDGITSSSLVACFFYMAKKMIQLRKCDIVGSIRSIRRTHYNFINFDQFVFLHDCALALYKNYFNH